MDRLDAVLHLEDQGQILAFRDFIVPEPDIVEGPLVDGCLEVLADSLVLRADRRVRELMLVPVRFDRQLVLPGTGLMCLV